MRSATNEAPELDAPTMSLAELRAKLNIRRVSLEEAKAELRERLAAYEREHGCSSKEMRDALGARLLTDTPEIASWMFDYRSLLRLEEISNSKAGSLTRDLCITPSAQ